MLPKSWFCNGPMQGLIIFSPQALQRHCPRTIYRAIGHSPTGWHLARLIGAIAAAYPTNAHQLVRGERIGKGSDDLQSIAVHKGRRCVLSCSVAHLRDWWGFLVGDHHCIPGTWERRARLPLGRLWEPVWAETRPSDWPNVQSVSRFDHRAHNPASSCDRRESCRRISPPQHEEDTRDRKQKRGARSGRQFLRDSGAVRSRNTRLIFAFWIPAGRHFFWLHSPDTAGSDYEWRTVDPSDLEKKISGSVGFRSHLKMFLPLQRVIIPKFCWLSLPVGQVLLQFTVSGCFSNCKKTNVSPASIFHRWRDPFLDEFI